MASPLAAAAFHCLPTSAGAWESGSRSRVNLIRSGRTQARALSPPGPARGAARPQGLAGRRGVRTENTAPGSAGAARVGDRGVPGSGDLCELSRRLRKGTAWGSCLGAGQRLGDCRAPGWRGIPQVCNRHRASQAGAATCGKAWRWGSGCRVAIRIPTAGVALPSPRGWRDAANQQEGTPAPSPPSLAVGDASPPAAGASHSLRGPRSEGARLQPRPPGSGGSGIPGGCKEGGRQENRRGTACSLLPSIDCRSSLRKSSGKNPEVSPLAVHSRKEDAAQPGAWAGSPHPPSERREARKVSKRHGDSYQKRPLLGLPGVERNEGRRAAGRGGLTLVGLRAGDFQACWLTNGWRDSRSAPEGGERRTVPARWAGASGIRSCLSDLRDLAQRRGAGALGSGWPQRQVQRLGGSHRLGENRRQRTSFEEAGRFQINPLILG